MAFDITTKRAAQTAKIDLKEGDGSPLLDAEGNQLTATMHGPGSKVWQAANAEMSRRRAEKMRKGGKMESAMDGAKEDQIEFLVRVTVSFDGWTYPEPDNAEWPTQADMFRAAYSDDQIGYIRDHLYSEVNDWSAFTKGSAKS